MSNHQAIAAVSAVLRSVVETAVQAALPDVSVSVSTGRPEEVDPGNNGAAVGVFLYQVIPNASWRNQDLPTRRADGSAARRPQAALDLHYLLTFFGDEGDQQPERLLGAVVSTLLAEPTLSRERIRAILPPSHALGGSGLDRQMDVVRFVPLPLNVEELSKLWSMFVQTAYRLSVAYQGSVVLIEPEATVEPTLPVRRRNVYVELMERPILDQVEGEDGPDAAIVYGQTLVLRGRRLAGDATRVVLRQGDEEVEGVPQPDDVSPGEIRIALDEPPFPAGGLRAGVAGVKVSHRRLMGEPGFETEHRGVDSNMLAFVLRPRIAAGAGLDGFDVTTGSEVPPPPPPPPPPAPDAEPVLTVGVEPQVAAEQEAVLLLHRSGESHAIPAWRRVADVDPVRFPTSAVGAGTYRLRIQVDGAESLLETDAEGLYVRPRVILP